MADRSRRRIVGRCRKVERGARYRNLAQTYTGDSGGELASAVRKGLNRVRPRWKYEHDRAPPADNRRRLQYRALTVNHGNVPSERTIKRALAGVPKSPAVLSRPTAHTENRTTEGDKRC